MPLVLLIVGIAFLSTSILGTQQELVALLKGDLIGTKSFMVWLLAIFLISLFGAIPGFKPVANAFLALFVVVILVGHRGFFDQFNSALKSAS